MHCSVRPAGWWVALREPEPGVFQTGTCHSQICGLVVSCLQVASLSSEQGPGSTASRLGRVGVFVRNLTFGAALRLPAAP